MATSRYIGVMIRLFAAQWPTHPISDDLVSLYESRFRNVPDEVLERAVVLCLDELVFWPKVVEVKQRVARVLLPNLPNPHDAWREVKRHLRAGHTQDAWSTPIIGQALEGIGGLRAFGKSPQEDESYWRTAFIKAFEVYRFRQEQAALSLPAGEMLELEAR